MLTLRFDGGAQMDGRVFERELAGFDSQKIQNVLQDGGKQLAASFHQDCLPARSGMRAAGKGEGQRNRGKRRSDRRNRSEPDSTNYTLVFSAGSVENVSARVEGISSLLRGIRKSFGKHNEIINKLRR